MPQVLRPKKVTDDLSVAVDTPKVADAPNVTNVNIRDALSSSNTEVKNVVSSVTPPSNLSASTIVNRAMPPVEVHDQPTAPEISDALQKLLEMKIGKTLASAKASLESTEKEVLNKTNQIVPPKPILGKEIRMPKPVEVVVPQQALPIENNPVINNQTINTVVQPTQPNTNPATPATTINNINAQNNLQPATVAVPVTEVVPKKSFLDKLLGF